MTQQIELVRRAQSSGDRAAFEKLVELNQGYVRSFLVRLCKNQALADDLAQDTFLTAHQKLNKYKATGSFASWVFAIAYRCFLAEKRKADQRSRLEMDVEVNPGYYESISPEQIDLERALHTLPEKEVAALTLCLGFGCSHSEVAEILDTPVGTVKTHVRRGRLKLVDVLG